LYNSYYVDGFVSTIQAVLQNIARSRNSCITSICLYNYITGNINPYITPK